MTEPDDINVVKNLLIGEQRENADLRAELKAQEAMCLECEWVAEPELGLKYCPYCLQQREYGHMDACEIKAVCDRIRARRTALAARGTK